MSKLVKAVRIREDRGEKLREKAIELTIKQKEHIREAEIVNYLIDEILERIDVDKDGLYLKEESQK